jgi:hypothetical protein
MHRTTVWVSTTVCALLIAGCGGGGGDDTSSDDPNVDVTPPSISAINSTATDSRAIITWTTNEPADSRVEYGLTATYGSSSTLATALETGHSMALNGLTPATTYHFRTRSSDAAGNLGLSADATFTTLATPDNTAPTVSITAPTSGSTVSGSLSVTATAQDNVGVVGVRFRLDNVNLGAEDTTSPYSTFWNTTTVANGAHALTAVARDAGGNTTTSAAVNVTVSNAMPDTTPPTVSLTVPAGGATVTGTVTVSATANDDTGVVGVQFRLDGAALGTEDLSAPYSIAWDTTATANGSHSLRALARDAAGNQTLSPIINVTVNNAPPPSGAAINAGQVVVDPPTLETLGVALPIVSGDTNHNARVLVSYRVLGQANWQTGLPLFRVRPEFLSEEDPTPFTVGRQFAGSIFDLTPDTEYEIQLDVQDPDGGSMTRTVTARTRPVPLANPATARNVPVSSLSALNTALANAAPGDVITLANGTYNGSITISRSGTDATPIFVRGESRDGAVLNASGAGTGVTVSGRYVTLENFTIRSSSWGVRITSSDNVVARRLHLTDISFGIEIRGSAKRNHYVCDNLLEGREAQWPETDSSVWDFEGIVITGEGHVVCHNTLSGFGDALGQHHNTSIPNRANDFYGNEVLWSGDNGVELDFTERNVRAFRNRFTNAGNHSISFQPVYGGPAYAIRNVMYNSATAPYKFNNEPTGMVVLHNTALRPGIAWAQYGARADNFIVMNNLFIGTPGPVVDMSTEISLAQIDYNGWRPDGTFRFFDSWSSFASLQANSPYEDNGRLLNAMPFAAVITIPGSYQTFVQPPDVRLSATTNALDAGVVLPNINDGFAGANPDLGAIERGSALPVYGVR